ncbi:hypothetical protein STA3757_02680 [Stanieria sp. NIES-3757]|nr:hypothetical protein STA3757_02680 [Stanieria sp. NIES-3757]
MNFNVYINDELGKELENLVSKTGKSRNSLITLALQLLIEQEYQSQWCDEIINWNGIEESISFESYRDELVPPSEMEIF